MVLIEVYKRNIQVSYKSRFVSKATFLILICSGFSIIFPFIFVYNTRGFLLERASFYEQPNINFTGEYIFIATTKTNNDSNPIICSTDVTYEEAILMYDVCSSMRYKEIDANFDGKIDEFVFYLELNLPIDAELTSFNLVLLHDFKLEDYFCQLQMQSAVIFQQFIPIPTTEIKIYADLSIIQKSPMFCHERYTNRHYNYSPLRNFTEEFNSTSNSTEFTSSSRLQNIIEEYSKRNLSTRLNNVYLTFSSNEPTLFQLDFRMIIPEMEFYYKPRLWHVFKWAWVQYFGIYTIVSWLVFRFKTYVFKNRLVLFYKYNPLKKKQ